MRKITLTNIAEELAHKSGLSKDAADNFMRAIVDTIEKGLREDNIVKIKGLGTFKLMEVSDRGSIDVNTGERITIKGYTKVTFTPDSAMKEFVNRPFAHFEPTELNEGFQDEELVVSEEQVATNIEEGEDAASTPLPVDMAPEENTDNTEDAALQPAEEKVEETATETAATDTEEIPVQEEVAESENNDSIETVITENIESIEMETVDNTEDTETAKEETAIVQATEQEQTTETEVAKQAAERKIIEAQAEASRRRLEGLADAEVMAAMGYSQRDVLQADVQKEYAKGIGQMGSNGGGAGGGIMSDILGLGVGMAAMGAMGEKVGGVMRDFNNPAPTTTSTTAPTGWKCSCGCEGNTGKFCSECGKAKPEAWDCPACGAKENKGKFCSECGAAKPEAWDCPHCGAKGNKGKFCSECGKSKEASATWDCAFGI